MYLRASDDDIYDVYIRDYVPLEDENGQLCPFEYQELEPIDPDAGV